MASMLHSGFVNSTVLVFTPGSPGEPGQHWEFCGEVSLALSPGVEEFDLGLGESGRPVRTYVAAATRRVTIEITQRGDRTERVQRPSLRRRMAVETLRGDEASARALADLYS